MRVFAKVAESGSFAGAAARLGISASMVTLHMKVLEERLGVRLAGHRFGDRDIVVSLPVAAACEAAA